MPVTVGAGVVGVGLGGAVVIVIEVFVVVGLAVGLPVGDGVEVGIGIVTLVDVAGVVVPVIVVEVALLRHPAARRTTSIRKTVWRYLYFMFPPRVCICASRQAE